MGVECLMVQLDCVMFISHDFCLWNTSFGLALRSDIRTVHNRYTLLATSRAQQHSRCNAHSAIRLGAPLVLRNSNIPYAAASPKNNNELTLAAIFITPTTCAFTTKQNDSPNTTV